ncbi:hypothetical protein JM93_01751 [Roseibium hamelinense]|uniref:Lipoprotein n=1 Tax=Roseibium hamelinense TaxID=150831 RepID=A0A562T8I3_9HYPH|nr:hypothetical protein [Roseibium hamelinense]MTI42363.1 hypothetical protein [Roseibium hamelinense]TWI89548.1 hypothetical protein JM93_01751 [Roseibium hamelinense]
MPEVFKVFAKAFFLIAALSALSACRESEENRPIKLDKGNYEGPADTELTEEQLRELRARGAKQGF